MDIAVNLVETYLRLNGYLTLAEFEVQARSKEGVFETLTDVDVMGLRLPGEIYVGDPHEGEDCRMLVINDPVLELEEDLTDVIIGEVKQGEAEFNPGLFRHEVLHSVLRRVEHLYATELDAVVSNLQAERIDRSPALGGGEIRTRLVAFGRSPGNDRHTISHGHIISTLLGYFDGLDDAFRPVQFRDPAPAMLNLLLKSGFDVNR